MYRPMIITSLPYTQHLPNYNRIFKQHQIIPIQFINHISQHLEKIKHDDIETLWRLLALILMIGIYYVNTIIKNFKELSIMH